MGFACSSKGTLTSGNARIDKRSQRRMVMGEFQCQYMKWTGTRFKLDTDRPRPSPRVTAALHSSAGRHSASKVHGDPRVIVTAERVVSRRIQPVCQWRHLVAEVVHAEAEAGTDRRHHI